MGVKTWMLVYADADVRTLLGLAEADDPAESAEFVRRLHPGRAVTPLEGSGWSLNPPEGTVYAGSFTGLTILATRDASIDHPSRLDRRFLAAADNRRLHLYATHSVVDWLAFASWDRAGELVRSLSLAPDSGVMEDIGERLPFEAPFWAGERPLRGDDGTYPLPFHPLELGEVATRALFGFSLEGSQADTVDIGRLTLSGYRID